MTQELGGGWNAVSLNYAYDAGSGWQWLPEAGVWVWVYEPYADLAGMVLVEGGTLSTSNELSGTDVATFYIGRYEVTWGEWLAVRAWGEENGYRWTSANDYPGKEPAGCASDHPVYNVSWYDVLKWCNAKSTKEGLMPVYMANGEVYRNGYPNLSITQNLSASGYRLPMEAEWEFAANGGNQTNSYTYSGSDDLDAVGWHWNSPGGGSCNLLSGRGTWPVGQKAPNELGLYDMTGNVAEWCWEQFESMIPLYSIRGGSWYVGSWKSSAYALSYRTGDSPDLRWFSIGFRLARSSGD